MLSVYTHPDSGLHHDRSYHRAHSAIVSWLGRCLDDASAQHILVIDAALDGVRRPATALPRSRKRMHRTPRAGSPLKRARGEVDRDDDGNDVEINLGEGFSPNTSQMETPRATQLSSTFSIPSRTTSTPFLDRHAPDDPFVIAPTSWPSVEPRGSFPSSVTTAPLAAEPDSSSPVRAPSESSRVSHTSTSSHTSTHRSGTTGGHARRSKSPVKKVMHLSLFDPPVLYQPYDKKALPADIKDLARTIATLEFHHQGIFPCAIKDQLLEELEEDDMPDWLFGSSTPDSSTEAVQHIHTQLVKIIHATQESTTWNRSEAAWNLLVHHPLLELAMSDLPNVGVELITTAQILPAFLPTFTPPNIRASTSTSTSTDTPTAAHSTIVPTSLVSATSFTSQGKMVDLALLLRPNPSSSPMLSSEMRNLFRRLPPGEQSLSQTDYGPLRAFPAPIAVESKTASGNMEEARVQLGVWVAAWFARMRKLIRNEQRKVMAVPVLMIEAEAWKVYFACETDNEIVLYGPQRLGETDSIRNIYILLACLKAIGAWLDISFREWFAVEVLGLPEGST